MINDRPAHRNCGSPAPQASTTALAGFAALALWAGAASAECGEDWAARLISAQGQVEIQTSDQGAWRPAMVEQHFCPGDKVRTLARSRASLQLRNQTYFSLDQRTTVVFSRVEADRPSWIELIAGALFARSRTPKPLNIRTPFINAAIKGTEFMVAVGSGKGEVTVFEGEVEAFNAAGQVTLAGGQTASARPGEAPRVHLALRPEDAVQWALYFPPLVDLAAVPRTGDPGLAKAAKAYAAGKLDEALADLDRVPDARHDADYLALKASMLLSVGRLDEAEPLLSAPTGSTPSPAVTGALRSVIALARNRKSEALELADAALRADAGSAPAWIARSYALQARFDLKGALDAANRAAGLSPGSALVQARRAELLASLELWGDAHRAADRAVRLDPRQPRARIVKGFAELRDNDLAAAEASFREASRLDPADPMARLGTGLAAIRRGEIPEGTAELEFATSLDPGNSLIRSYLGKAYYEQRRNGVAGTQFELAERFDPKDPTPRFYDAIMKQTENRPVEALHDLQEAIALNGNRAVYRSKLTLDQDLASRSAALARIYNDLGFAPRALVEGWKSVNVDPGNFSAHRLLADAYAALPGQEVARASELLQSQLLQPINSTPVQPHLAESRLLVPDLSGPAQMSFNEFNPAFSRNGFHLQTSGLVGNLGTYGDEAVHSGIWNNFSYSLGQFHYQSEGFRPNNAINQDIYNAFAQVAITPDLSVQAEYRHRELEHGDLLFNGDLQAFDPAYRRNLRTDTVRSGLHYAPTNRSDVILSLIYLDSLVNGVAFGGEITNTVSQRGFLGEAQYLYRADIFDTVAGVGRQDLSAGISGNTIPVRLAYDIDLTNAYLYSHVHYPESVTWTLGLSVDSSHNQWAGGRDQVNPKFGLLWELTPDTLLRLAAFRTFTRGIEVPATLEPTQVAGFNQFFDGFTGSDATRYGVGLDHRFAPGFLVGAEASRRDLKFPAPLGYSTRAPTFISHQDQNLVRAYADWAINESFAARLEYLYDTFTVNELSIYKNHIIPVGLNYFHPSGVSLGTTFTYVQQEGSEEESNSQFGLVDLALRYRLPRRYGMASLMVKNLLDHEFDFVGSNPYGFRSGRLEETPLFIPDRTIALQLTLAF